MIWILAILSLAVTVMFLLLESMKKRLDTACEQLSAQRDANQILLRVPAEVVRMMVMENCLKPDVTDEALRDLLK